MFTSDCCGPQVQLPQFRHEGLQVTAIYSRSMSRAITLAAEVRSVACQGAACAQLRHQECTALTRSRLDVLRSITCHTPSTMSQRCASLRRVR